MLQKFHKGWDSETNLRENTLKQGLRGLGKVSIKDESSSYTEFLKELGTFSLYDQWIMKIVYCEDQKPIILFVKIF